ncbi:hypothetical protein [Pseudomonas sp. NPDC086251]|uniref:hypothetical protein n=1 Tax=Pseudomonas sp. NPDC086251 TaxID=3364431 RepID=UPI0038356563
MSTDRVDVQAVHGEVVVIDENAAIRMLLAETLSEIGLTSIVFDNVDAAMNYLLSVQGNCALIIADQGISSSSQAIDFIQKAAEEWPSIPAILTSGHVIEDHLIPPSSTYLRKPYTLDQFESIILTILQTHIALPQK